MKNYAITWKSFFSYNILRIQSGNKIFFSNTDDYNIAIGWKEVLNVFRQSFNRHSASFIPLDWKYGVDVTLQAHVIE